MESLSAKFEVALELSKSLKSGVDRVVIDFHKICKRNERESLELYEWARKAYPELTITASFNEDKILVCFELS